MFSFCRNDIAFEIHRDEVPPAQEELVEAPKKKRNKKVQFAKLVP